MRILGFMRHLGEYGLSPISYYRVGLPLRALDEYTEHKADAYNQLGLYNRFRSTLDSGGDLHEALEGYDIYVLGRLYRDGGIEEYIEQVHNQGAKVVFDTDDDMSEQFREIDGKGNAFSKTLELVDLVTVSTPYLAERVAPYTKQDPVVLPNYIDTGWFGKLSLTASKEHQGLNIGVIGTQTHYHDWECLAEPFAKIANEYDGVNILAAGFQPDYLSDYKYLEPVPYEDYPWMVREFDIVCCALDSDDKFNHSKSSIKALEAMASARKLSDGRIGGAVAVCTDMPVYQRAINHMRNGMLVDDWYEALKMLIEDEMTRNQIAYQGHKWVRSNRDIRDGYTLWESAYSNLLRS